MLRPIRAYLLLTFVSAYLCGNIFSQSPPGARYKPITLNPSYEHTKWGIEPHDKVYNFAAYTVSFDSNDDNNGDGLEDAWGVPEWVAYEVKEDMGIAIPDYNRPTWMTDDTLNQQGFCPNDNTYKVSGTSQLPEVKTDYRYVRGHMCPKDVADRISMEAGWNTHTVLNAVPQLQWQNNEIWKDLEAQVTEWADEYGRIWVICGPIFFDMTPAVWLGQTGEVRAAVPDALYKIVIREDENGLLTLSFVMPNVVPKKKNFNPEMNYKHFLTSMRRIEDLTGITFLTTTSLSQIELNNEKGKNLDLNNGQKRSRVNSW